MPKTKEKGKLAINESAETATKVHAGPGTEVHVVMATMEGMSYPVRVSTDIKDAQECGKGWLTIAEAVSITTYPLNADIPVPAGTGRS